MAKAAEQAPTDQPDAPAPEPQDQPQSEQPVIYIVNGVRVDPNGKPV